MTDADANTSILVVDTSGNIGSLLDTLSRAGYRARVATETEITQGRLPTSPVVMAERPGMHTDGGGSGAATNAPPPGGAGEVLTLQALERAHIITVLRRTHGVIEGPKGAARLLDLKPSTARFRMKKLGIARADYSRDS
jgi:transcriptional regulator with GAF, ATPase, and Fis domain